MHTYQIKTPSKPHNNDIQLIFWARWENYGSMNFLSPSPIS